MATISIQLKLNKSPFFFFRDSSVKKESEGYIVDTSDESAIRAIIRGINDERISSDTSIEVLKQYLPGSGTGGGGGSSTPGLPGESAYQIAKRLGQANGMSESQWIASLKGPKGDKGDNGNDFNFTADPLLEYTKAKAGN